MMRRFNLRKAIMRLSERERFKRNADTNRRRDLGREVGGCSCWRERTPYFSRRSPIRSSKPNSRSCRRTRAGRGYARGSRLRRRIRRRSRRCTGSVATGQALPGQRRSRRERRRRRANGR